MMKISVILLVFVMILPCASGARAGDVDILRVPDNILASDRTEARAFTLPSDDGASGAGKSTGKAALMSAVLPGWGHHYLGEQRTAITFFAIEAAVWTSYITFQIQGYQRENGYEQFAIDRAGVLRTGHSDDYYSILTKYNTSEEYEAALKREGRFELYPANAEDLENYFVANRVADYEPWAWPSAEVRRDYQERRSGSKRAYRRGTYALATALANRAAAVFFAVRSSRSINQAASEANFRVEFGPPGRGMSDEFETGVSIVKKF